MRHDVIKGGLASFDSSEFYRDYIDITTTHRFWGAKTTRSFETAALDKALQDFSDKFRYVAVPKKIPITYSTPPFTRDIRNQWQQCTHAIAACDAWLSKKSGSSRYSAVEKTKQQLMAVKTALESQFDTAAKRELGAMASDYMKFTPAMTDLLAERRKQNRLRDFQPSVAPLPPVRPAKPKPREVSRAPAAKALSSKLSSSLFSKPVTASVVDRHENKPFNFREIPADKLPSDIRVKVAGMARPGYDGHGQHGIERKIYPGYARIVRHKERDELVCRYLAKNNYKHVVSFEGADVLRPSVDRLGGVYSHHPLEDFSSDGLTPDFLDMIYQKIKTSSDGVVLHCAAGMGRTGTCLAALMLRRKIEDKIEAGEYDHVVEDEDSQLLPSNYILADFQLADIKEKYMVECTPLVAEVVTELRNLEKETGNQTHYSVENAGNIASLCEYQKHVVQELLPKMRVAHGAGY
ncbi:MAG: protein-tyrosine phosphatase family protein [Coxiellaceae bacterium]|nr:protein-tyrosine phosphatase family protein [Coxiellaceae bacterium]